MGRWRLLVKIDSIVFKNAYQIGLEQRFDLRVPARKLPRADFSCWVNFEAEKAGRCFLSKASAFVPRKYRPSSVGRFSEIGVSPMASLESGGEGRFFDSTGPEFELFGKESLRILASIAQMV
jgi:hypothetical protein